MEKIKTKKQLEKRNNSYSPCHNYNCSFNTSRCFNSNVNRREWNTYTSTKSKNRN